MPSPRSRRPSRSSTSGSARPATTPTSSAGSACSSRCAPTRPGSAQREWLAVVGAPRRRRRRLPVAAAGGARARATTPSSRAPTPTTPRSGPDGAVTLGEPDRLRRGRRRPRRIRDQGRTLPHHDPAARDRAGQQDARRMPRPRRCGRRGLTVTRRQQAGRALTQLERQEGYQSAIDACRPRRRTCRCCTRRTSPGACASRCGTR